MCFKRRMPYIVPITVIVLLWTLLHIFTLSWGLPNFSPFEVDAVPAQQGLNAKEMMHLSTYNYPPLQYIILDKLSSVFLRPGTDELTNTSSKIYFSRLISSLMELGISLVIFAVCFLIFGMPLLDQQQHFL